MVGAYSKLVYGKGIDSSEPILRQTLQELTDAQRHEFMSKVRADIENDEYHSYTLWYVSWTDLADMVGPWLRLENRLLDRRRRISFEDVTSVSLIPL